jgi:hypothetical protein
MIASNLPVENLDSADKVKTFFDNYFIQSISYPAAEIDAVVSFFRSRGFDEVASNSTAIVLLQQAKIDNVSVFKVLDTMSGFESVQISAIVAEVINYNRQKTSTLGYRTEDSSNLLEMRNIIV